MLRGTINTLSIAFQAASQSGKKALSRTAFKLLNEGPAILAVKSLEERLSQLEAI